MSFTVATWSRRTLWPLLRVSCRRANSSTVFTVARVRIGCSLPPRSARPPALSVCTWRNWREISAAVAPRDCSLSGSSSTATSRLTPPTRTTLPTPFTPSRRRATVLSTNQLRASSSMLGERMVRAKMGAPDRLILLTTGSRKSLGKSERTPCTALRTSSTASWVGFSSRNSAVMVTPPSCTLVKIFFKPCKGASAFSILRATSVSSCAGAAPGSEADTVTVGNSRSGKFCTFMLWKDNSPAKQSITNSMMAGIGFLIDHAERFILHAPYFLASGAASTTRTTSPSVKKLAPLATRRSCGVTPASSSICSPTRRPVCTLSCTTRLSGPTRST